MNTKHSVVPILAEGPDGTDAEPTTFDEFIGQDRIKTLLRLAIAAAKESEEWLGHILLVGPPGFGKATLAKLIGKAIGENVKRTNGMAIGSRGDLLGLLTNLEEREVFLVEDIHALDRPTAEFLSPPMKDYKMEIVIDAGPNARSVPLNLPCFTLIATTTRKERIPASLLASFRIVADMDAYSNRDLANIARQVARVMGLEVDEEVPEKVAMSARVSPSEVLNRLRHLRDYAYVKAHSRRITTEMAVEALKMVAPAHGVDESPKERHPKTGYNPNTAFIMMWMDKSHADLDDVSNALKEVCAEFGITAVRADDVEHQDRITDLVLNHIRDSEFLVADLSGERPNVYYEIGYAHALGKRPILYRKEGTKLHFDLSVHNVPDYRNITHLKDLLRKRLEFITGRRLKAALRNRGRTPDKGKPKG